MTRRLRAWARGPRARTRALQALIAAVFLVVWQIVGATQPRLYSQPTRVLNATVELVHRQNLVGVLAHDLTTLVIGLVLSIVLGIAVGIVIVRFETVEIAMQPYLTILYSMPRSAVVPILVLWFGIGQTFLLAAIVFATAILLIFPTVAGLRESRRMYDEVARSFAVGDRFLFVRILLPASIPYISSGIRLAVPRALVALLVAQFWVGVPGLGSLISDARANLISDTVFALGIVSLLLAFVVTVVAESADRRLRRWQPSAY